MPIKVAVRVRPFNARELVENSTLCISMNGPTTILLDSVDSKKIEILLLIIHFGHTIHSKMIRMVTVEHYQIQIIQKNQRVQ